MQRKVVITDCMTHFRISLYTEVTPIQVHPDTTN